MPRFLVTYEIEEANEADAHSSMATDAECDTVFEIKLDSTDQYTVPLGHSVLVGLGCNQFVLAKVSGWCTEHIYTHAKHVQLPPGELIMIAHTADQFSLPPIQVHVPHYVGDENVGLLSVGIPYGKVDTLCKAVTVALENGGEDAWEALRIVARELHIAS